MQSAVNRSSDKSLKCLSLGEEAYSSAKQMATEDSLSVSAFLRGLIKRTYLKWSRNKKIGERSIEA